jgi:7,8-dihydro-6-hydroxymethylpterin-pyrophosphokinase
MNSISLSLSLLPVMDTLYKIENSVRKVARARPRVRRPVSDRTLGLDVLYCEEGSKPPVEYDSMPLIIEVLLTSEKYYLCSRAERPQN